MNDSVKRMIDWLHVGITFDPNSPMIFTRMIFWIFLLLVFVGYTFVYQKHRKAQRSLYLLLVSLFFYYKSSGLYFAILLFSTLVDFLIGNKIYKAKSLTSKKIWLALSLIINLSVLCYFKYSYFLVEQINDLFGLHLQTVSYLSQFANSFFASSFDIGTIILPVGISFFTFQTISYSIDVYRSKIAPLRNIIDFGFYVSFFPQLVAGPIVRAEGFIKQIHAEYRVSKQEFGLAIFLILSGLIKKMLVGDYLAINLVDRVFSDPEMFTGIENILASFGYTLQIYADFSGYTDIAIGIALLFGFRLPINFNAPFKANNIQDFWKRWHISLSSWLKDYLYIPIGGNRRHSIFSYVGFIILAALLVLNSGFKPWIPSLLIACILALFIFFPNLRKGFFTNLNLLLTMLLGGLWHGASMQFVIWGAMHGIALIVFKNWQKAFPSPENPPFIRKAIGRILTFTFITVAFVYFRSESMQVANSIFKQIFHNSNLMQLSVVISGYFKVIMVLIFGFTIHWIPETWKEYIKNLFIRSHIWFKVLITVLVIVLLYQISNSQMIPFIYFQF